MKSLYLKHFIKNKDIISSLVELTGDILLVEQFELPEQKTSSGIILVETKNQQGAINDAKPLFFRVLYVGAGFYDDITHESVLNNCQQGDIIVTGLASVKLLPMLPTVKKYKPFSIGITREADVLLRFKGESAFEEFLQGLDEGIQAIDKKEEV